MYDTFDQQMQFLLISEPLYIVEEYLCNGNLKCVLECSRQPNACIHENIHHRFIKLDQKKLLQMAQQIADGMDFIASSKVNNQSFV